MKKILQKIAKVNPKALQVIKKQLGYLFSGEKLRVTVRINYNPKDVPFEISFYWGMLHKTKHSNNFPLRLKYSI